MAQPLSYVNGYPVGATRQMTPVLNGGVWWGHGKQPEPVTFALQNPSDCTNELSMGFGRPLGFGTVQSARRWEHEGPAVTQQWRTFELNYGGIPPQSSAPDAAFF